MAPERACKPGEHRGRIGARSGLSEHRFCESTEMDLREMSSFGAKDELEATNLAQRNVVILAAMEPFGGWKVLVAIFSQGGA